MRTILLICAACVAMAAVIGWSTAPAAVAAPTVRAYVDDPNVAVGEEFMLMIEINGQSKGRPSIPQVDGLNISSHPSTTSSSMQFSNTTGTISKNVYGYTGFATRAGKFTIPPITVTVDGTQQTTGAIEINAAESTVPQPAQQAPAPSPRQNWPRLPGLAQPPQQAQPPARSGGVTLDEAVFVETRVDKTEVYQGEPIQLALSIWVLMAPGFHVSHRSPQLEPPSCEGFYPTPFEEDSAETTRDGHPYQVVSYARTLYPTVSGDLQIGEWRWQGVVTYNSRAIVERVAPPIPIRVKELPDAPPEFHGAVGHFTLDAKLSREDGVQGVPMELVVTVRGKGNPDAVGEPQMPQIEKAYISDPNRSPAPTEPSGSADVEKTFTYLITPLESGQLTIPPVRYCYFDPAAAAYQTQATPPLTVLVKQSAEYGAGPRKLVKAEEEPKATGAVSVIGDDLFPLAAAPAGLKPTYRSGAGLPAAAAAPVAAYALLALLMRRKRRLESDPAYARARRARAQGLKRLHAAAGSAEPAEELYRALIGYVADRYNLQESGLTSQEITAALESRNVDPDVKEHVRKILRACERTRYGGSKLSVDELEALVRGATEAIERLESPGAEVAQ